jgi:hypothetical protein
MATVGRSAVCIRIVGDNLDPHEVSSALGASGTIEQRRGDRGLTSLGQEIVARTGAWVLSTKDRQLADLDGQIAELFSSLTADLDRWQTLVSRYRGEIFCGLFLADSNEGLSIDAETVAAIAARGLAIDFDIYGSRE